HVPPKFPHNVTDIDISHNNIKEIKSGDFQNLTYLKTLNISCNSISYVEKGAFRDLISLTELGLSSNHLTRITKEFFHGLTNLKVLLLDRNNISTIENSSFSVFHHLQIQTLDEIHIDSNNISIFQSIDVSNSSLRLQILNLADNPLNIFRISADIFPYLQAINLSYCFSNTSLEWDVLNTSFFRNVKRLDMSGVSVPLKQFNMILQTFNNSLVELILKTKKGSNKPSGFQYDAFVSYNKHDELWVTSELLPKLEGEQGWRLCLHHRDFQPGKPIVDNIVDGIYSSRKTICILSQHYLESEWCSKEVQVASFRLFDEKKDVLILVFLEDIPVYRLSPYYRMRGLVKKHTYLSWPKVGQDTRIFWEKLRVALGTRRGSEEENSLSDVQNVL
ncbi:toll-like receptor 13, partial [Sardina pilchardus]|uniref:toll-like receptor 13 n=1 Tax=Sardina pilchardus TaxID=27697 RepID=UPI002E0E5349